MGIQDQISASFGGLNKLDIKKNGDFDVKKIKINKPIKNLDKNLVLLFTGIQRTANDIAGQYVSKLKKDKIMEMKEINFQVEEAEQLLLKNKFDDFGKLLNDGWKLKKSLSKVISNKKIDDLYEIFYKQWCFGREIIRCWWRWLYVAIYTKS